MDLLDFWVKKLAKYSLEPWAKEPNIFATEIVKYFPKTGKVLDLAAGLGQDSKYFSSLGYSVTTTDLIPPSEIVDLNSPLTYSSNSFDVVYSHLGLHYFSQDRTRSLFQEIFNILKPNGIFCSIFNSVADPEILELIKVDTDYYQTVEGINKRFFSTKSLKQILPPKLKIILLDSNGKTVKDCNNHLIRLVCQK